jgi:hypothetical protein
MNDIRNFTLFSLQPKSAIEISGLVNWIFQNKLIN